MHSMPNWYDLNEEWFTRIPSGHERFENLMRLALHALKAEDDDISSRFSLGAARRFASKEHTHYNQGVGTLYETTIAYTIFKTWLPVAPAGWEAAYPSNSAWKADLVMRDTDGNAQWVFEVKWWLNNRAKTLSVLQDDIDKLRTWSPADERFLLALWYGRRSDYKRDRDAMLSGCAQFEKVEPVYLGGFATDIATYRQDGGGYFAVGVVRLR